MVVDATLVLSRVPLYQPLSTCYHYQYEPYVQVDCSSSACQPFMYRRASNSPIPTWFGVAIILCSICVDSKLQSHPFVDQYMYHEFSPVKISSSEARTTSGTQDPAFAGEGFQRTLHAHFLVKLVQVS